MGSTFNPQILVDKLAKLNNSQASIETLSHWCIFHMNKAKYVVETWDRQFHCSPREQRLAFLYLANDILQNSRRKGSEFVGEFWKVLPNALHYVVKSGDEAGRNAALRLIGIWEERKVFGSRAQNLKDEFLGKHLEKNNREVKNLGNKLPVGSMLDKIVSSYHAVYGEHMDEDISLGKCRKAISYIEKVDKEMGPDMHQDQFHEAALVEELQGQHAILRDSIRELSLIESLRANLVSQLREVILEQESKLEQVRNQLQVANSLSGRAGDICQQLRANNAELVEEQSSKVADTSTAPQNFVAGDRELSAPAMYARDASFTENTNHVKEDPRKSAAAAVAEKLTASSSSAQMLSYVLSSLASEGVIGTARKEPSTDYPSEKRAKLENDQPYIPTHSPQLPPNPAYGHPESFQSNMTTVTPQLTTREPPPPPSSPPPLAPPLPPASQYLMPPYIPSTGQINSMPYGFNMSQQQRPSLPGYSTIGTPMTGMTPFPMPPTNPYQAYQGVDGNLYSQPSTMPTTPMSRQ